MAVDLADPENESAPKNLLNRDCAETIENIITTINL